MIINECNKTKPNIKYQHRDFDVALVAHRDRRGLKIVLHSADKYQEVRYKSKLLRIKEFILNIITFQYCAPKPDKASGTHFV